MSETKKFKTETKRLLDLMINSIYTNKEIFLRELISNASDAIDKYHYLSLTTDLEKRNDYEIRIELNKDLRAISISDNGIGMTKDEIVANLGTIAKSGSLDFIKKMEEEKNDEAAEAEIIGQFGVGFYSSYMVGNEVVVETLSPYSNTAYRFTSKGEETYKLEETNKNGIGTKITIYLRENSDEYDYDKFLNQHTIKMLVKKYSDYVRYPIKMNVTKSIPVNDSDEYQEVVEEEILNSMLPLWKRNKKEVSEDELNEFFKNKFNEYENPLLSMFFNIEGNITYNAMVFIPKVVPYNLYSDKYEKGLQLYTKGVFIMDKCKDLIPDYLRFVKGLVDSNDLSLNISREILQQDKQLIKIATNLEKKIISELSKLLKNDREKYNEFFNSYGLNLKYGLYESYGAKKDLLQDLLLFNSVNSDHKITLDEYVLSMVENQDSIYYASGKNKDAVLSSPQMDQIKKKGYDCLILTDDVDEFMINILAEYKEKKFKSINQGDLDLLTDEEKNEIKSLEEENKKLLEKIKKSLDGKVKDVILSKRLTDSPICLSSGEGLSFEMEKVLSQMPNNNELKADRILEINPNHEILKAIENANDEDIKMYSKLLYNQALLIEGLPIEDPNEFSKLMCQLMVKKSK